MARRPSMRGKGYYANYSVGGRPLAHPYKRKTFRRRRKCGCFLTSACVSYMGLQDDCRELTELRAFRDNVMCSTQEGRLLIEEYYQIAPLIVDAINNSAEKDAIYEDIYNIIQQCLSLIESKQYDQTMELYKAMVNKYRSMICQ